MSETGAPTPSPTRLRYENAVAALVEQLQADRLVLAVILGGSLANDEVWEKSDIDLFVVMADDAKTARSQCLDADGINVHAYPVRRSAFKDLVQRSHQGTFMNSTLSVSKILFARDESIIDLFNTLGHLGGRDREIAMLGAITHIFPALNKAEKWLYAKHDPLYCFFWIMKLVDGVSRLETFYHGELPGREVVHQALRYNPTLIGAIYTDLIEGPKTVAAMESALTIIREHLLHRREAYAPILDYLDEADGLRSVSEISHYFERQLGVEGVEMAFEWLAEQGIIQRMSVPGRLTAKSRATVDEVAFTR